MARRQGTIRHLHDDRWIVRLTLGRDAQGKSVRLNKTVRGSKRDAQRVLNDWAKRKDDGILAPLGRETLDQWREEWLQKWCGGRSPRTVHDYRTDLARYLSAELRTLRLTALTASHVQAWIGELRNRGLSPRTIRKAHGALRACLSKAVRLGKIFRNVAALAELPRSAHHEMRFLTPEEAHRFLGVAAGTRWHALFTVLLTTGLRPGEALALQWSDFDGERLVVQRAVTHAGSVTLVGPTKTGRKRVISLDSRTSAALRKHRVTQLEQKLQLGDSFDDSGLIFSNDFGRLADERNIRDRHFRPLLTKAGLRPMRLYDLRHTAASLLFAAGEDMKTVQDRLGHASIVLTMNTYTHLAEEIRRRTAARLDILFDRIAATIT